MATDVFICWSGDRSKAIAKAFSEKLSEATGAETFYSPEIEPGRLWFPQVSEKLAGAQAGILCITMENIDSPWLHYEAGFLCSRLVAGAGRPRDPEGVIFPYLFKVSPEAIQGGPLAAFQAVEATPEGTRRLIETLRRIFKSAGNFDFREWWKDFERRFEDFQPSPIQRIFDIGRLFDRKTFNEPVYLCSDQSWRARYDGARETQAALSRYVDVIETACAGATMDLYRLLIAAVDAYAMDLSATLLPDQRFPRDETDGRVLIEPMGAGASCEARRLRVKELVARLVDPAQQPRLPESVRFSQLETFEEKKNLIHRTESDLPKYSNQDELDRLGRSDWDFDRIVWALIQERNIREKREGSGPDLARATDQVRLELEKVSTRPCGVSMMPLHYGTGPLRVLLKDGEGPLDDADLQAVGEVLDQLSEYFDRCKVGGRVASDADEIRRLVDSRTSTDAKRRV